jgi:hypothetical protein
MEFFTFFRKPFFISRIVLKKENSHFIIIIIIWCFTHIRCQYKYRFSVKFKVKLHHKEQHKKISALKTCSCKLERRKWFEVGEYFKLISWRPRKIQHFSSLAMWRLLVYDDSEVDWKRDWFSHRDKATAENNFTLKEKPQKNFKKVTSEPLFYDCRMQCIIYNTILGHMKKKSWPCESTVKNWLSASLTQQSTYKHIHPQCRPATVVVIVCTLQDGHHMICGVIIIISCSHSTTTGPAQYKLLNDMRECEETIINVHS